MRITMLTGASLALALTLSSAAGASELFATTYTGGASDLYTVNQSTGAISLVGNTGVNFGDLTSTNSQLLGVDLTNNALWTINPLTGAASNEVLISGSNGVITSIAWDPVTHALYGDTTSGFGGADQLYAINSTTGAATLVGGIGSANIYALGFSQTGVLLGESDATGELVSISTTTGAGTDIGPTGISASYDLASRPGDDVVFGLGSATFGLYTFNTATGAASLVGPYGQDVNLAGLAFLPAGGGGGAAPEPATWVMMVAGFGGLGFVAYRRSRKPAIA
jgi:PEP-CTERM motif-containing protein